MDKKIIVELIKLEVLNQCSPEDTDALKFLKRNDDNFPWKEYGDYQNLIAVLSIRPEKLLPRQNLKNEIINKAGKLKHLQIPESVGDEVKIKGKTVLNLSKNSGSEEQKPEEIKKELSSLKNDLEEIIEETDIGETEEEIIDGSDNYVMLKQPELFKSQNGEDKSENSVDESKDELNDNSVKETPDKNDNVIQVENEIAEEHKEEIEEEDDEQQGNVNEELITTGKISGSNSGSFEKDNSHKEIKSSKRNNGRSLNRNSKSSLVVLLALIIISVPLVLFITSSSKDENKNSDEVINQLLKKPGEILITEEDKSEPSAEITGVVSVEGINEVVKEDLPAQNSETNKEQLLPEPEPVFIEPKDLEPVKDLSIKNIQTGNNKIMPPKEIKSNEEPAFFVAVEEMPQPIGGLAEIQKRVIYPRIASLSGKEGKVIIQAIVDETGNVTEAEVIKGIGFGCDEAALKAIYETKFKPGKQRGKTVKVRMTIPIVFKK